MAPIWPFKKKEPVAELDEEPPAPVVYRRGEDPNAREHVTSDQHAYKDALALFGGGSQTVEAATDQATKYDGVTDESPAADAPDSSPSVESEPEPAFTWVHHSDGYHYKQHADGSFDATPHVKNGDGTYAPYS
jgi:hypothetical protein